MAEKGKQEGIGREEQLLFNSFALMQVVNALVSLKAVDDMCAKCAGKATVVPALIRDAVVQYASLYKWSYVGDRRWQLEASGVPNEFKEIHQRMIEYRDKFFAHIDFELRNPERIDEKEGLCYHIDNKGAYEFIDKIPEMKGLMQHIIKRLGSEVGGEYRRLSGREGGGV